MKRVVVTGLGAITPIGKNVDEFWKGIKTGVCGIDEIKSFDTTNFKVKLAGEVKDYNEEDYFEKKIAKRLDKFTQYAMIASREAVKDANINVDEIDAERFGVIVSSGIGGLKTIEDNDHILMEKGPDRVSPMFIPMAICNMAARKYCYRCWSKRRIFCNSNSMCFSNTFNRRGI